MSSSDVPSSQVSEDPADLSGRSSSPDIDYTDPQANKKLVKTLKRQVAEHERRENQKAGKRIRTALTHGRGIRKVITLYDSLSTIMDEFERQGRIRAAKEKANANPSAVEEPSEPASEEANSEETRTQARLVNAWPLLLSIIPGFQDKLLTLRTDELLDYFCELQRGANCARSDDVNRIRADVANWVNEDYAPTEMIKTTDRANRGLQHDVCGLLLCPMMYNWGDMEVRAKIRESKEGFEINTNYYLRCLYASTPEFNPRRIEQGFLRSKLLLKTYCSIFTSPSSAQGISTEAESDSTAPLAGPSKSGRATKASVSSMLGMDGIVTGRSIAYAAVMLVFNLTDASQWTTTHNNFSFQGFYNFLVDYFEEERSAAGNARVGELLKWWKSHIFPRHVAVSKDMDHSRQLLLAQDDDY